MRVAEAGPAAPGRGEGGGRPPADERRPESLTYQGSRFPWWLTLLWLAFAVWGATYLAIYFLPDLKGWLQR